jgi:serine/threonine-protein kinase
MQQGLIGQTLGNYRVTERLGQGGNAVVYRAKQLALNRFVTLKVIQAGDREAHERLQRESRVLAQLQHRGIRQVYGIETAGAYVFAVLEYVEHSLKHLIEERRLRRQGFTLAEAVQLLQPVAEVLDFLHAKRWVHLDVKPENIMVAADGRVLLADFGVAQPFGPPQSHGTPAYVPPEVLTNRPVDAAADIYSLGVIAFEMLAGRTPFVGDSAIAVHHQTLHTPPPQLDRVERRIGNSTAWVVSRALAKEPQQRYVTAAAFLDDLERSKTFSRKLTTLPQRRPVPTAIAAGTLVCVSALAVGLRAFTPLPGLPPTRVVLVTATPSPVLTATAEETRVTPAAEGGPAVIISLTKSPTMPPTSTRAPDPTRTPVPERTATVPPSPAPRGPACTNPDAAAGAVITEPTARAELPIGTITLRGSARLPGSTGYEIRYRRQDENNAHVISGFPGQVDGDELGVWDPGQLKLPAGAYILTLRVKLADGNYKDCDVPITLR